MASLEVANEFEVAQIMSIMINDLDYCISNVSSKCFSPSCYYWSSYPVVHFKVHNTHECVNSGRSNIILSLVLLLFLAWSISYEH